MGKLLTDEYLSSLGLKIDRIGKIFDGGYLIGEVVGYFRRHTDDPPTTIKILYLPMTTDIGPIRSAADLRELCIKHDISYIEVEKKMALNNLGTILGSLRSEVTETEGLISKLTSKK